MTGNEELHSDTPLPLVPLLVIVLGAFMAILDGTIVNVALPKLMAVFGVGTAKIEWVTTLRVTHIFSHIMVALDICHDLLLQGS